MAQLQDLVGKTALVTGATSGIGMETAAALAGGRVGAAAQHNHA
jgi:NAD(P)-dependent dehydrogenase (short-subunit alcohol dehydrogenase family)